MKCKATNKRGEPCHAHAMKNGYCWLHNPEISEDLKQEARKRGGLKYDPTGLAETAQPIDFGSYEGMVAGLERNVNDLRNGTITPRLSNAIVQSVEAIIKVEKIRDLDERLTALETKLAGRRV